MFGKNSNPRKSVMRNETPGQPNINIISAGSVFTGTMKSKSDLRISGTVEGEVNADGKCIVSESGQITGDLITKEADIAGTIKGELKVSNRLILRSSAKIIGDIHTKVLMVEEGAHIDGSCKMGDHVSSNSGSKSDSGSKSIEQNQKGAWKKEPEKSTGA